MIQKLKELRNRHLKIHEIEFYDYQIEFSDKILESLVSNYEAIKSKDEKEIKKLKSIEIPVEFSRQSGKTTALVYTVEFLMNYFSLITKRNFSIGIFAPQREQAKTDFDRLKFALEISGRAFGFKPIEANAQTLRIPCGDNISECYIFSVTKTSQPESKTLDLLIFEEAQGMDDQEMIADIFPMGKTTNAPRIFIGTAGTQLCYFYKLLQKPIALIYDCDEIISQRRKLYDKTGEVRHLVYEQSVNQDRVLLGADSDEFQRPYKLVWNIGSGQFVTWEGFDKLIGNYSRVNNYTSGECFAGIDTAKNPDSTVVTMLRINHETRKKQLINWLELRGDNYQDQFDIIMDFLSRYNVKAVALDATGQGDFMPDMFERHSRWSSEINGLYRVKFSLSSKDVIYKNLKVVIRELLTEIPRIETKEADKFKSQLLDLQQEYRGEFLSCHHPDLNNAHDDYCDSWALAEHAYAQYTIKPQIDINFL